MNKRIYDWVVTAAVIAVACCWAGLSRGEEAGAPVRDAAPPEEVQKHFEFLAGDWEVEGNVDQDRFTAKYSYQWAPGKHALVHHWAGSFGATPVHGAAILGWDAKAGKVVDFGFIRELGWRAIRYTPNAAGTWVGDIEGVIRGEDLRAEIKVQVTGEDSFVVTSALGPNNPQQEYRCRRVALANSAKGEGISSAYEHLKPLEWGNGEWVGEYTATFTVGPIKEGDHVTSYASQRWMLNKSFLVADCALEINGRRIPDTHEVSGWDSVGKKVVHWIYSPMGTGTGEWTRVGDQAALRWSVDTEDGKFEGTSFIEKKDADTYTLQVREVSLGGQKQDDWPLVTYHRKTGAAAGDLWQAWRDAGKGTWLGTGTIGRDIQELGFAKGDDFEYRMIATPEAEGTVLTSDGTFRVRGKDHTVMVRAMDCWDPELRQVRSVACWSNGLVEEIVIQRKKGTAFLGTYAAKSPGGATERAAVSFDYPDPDSNVIKYTDGPRKGEVMSSWKRVK